MEEQAEELRELMKDENTEAPAKSTYSSESTEGAKKLITRE